MLFDIEASYREAISLRQSARTTAEREAAAEAVKRIDEERSSRLEQADAAFNRDADLYESFRTQMEGLFRAIEGEPKTYTRKPNISLRLIVDGQPKSKMIAIPIWDPRKKTIDCSRIQCELLTGRDVVTSSGLGTRVKINLIAGRSGVFSYPRGVVEDLGRVASTIRDFLRDRGADLARAHDHCGVCGRLLTDEMSRGRGIGPECIHKLPWLLGVIAEGSIVVPQ